MYRTGDLIVVTGAEIPGNDHTGAHGGADEKAGEKKDEAAGGGDRRQRLFAQISADDPCIGGIIELLKKLSEKNRHGKGGNDPLGVALRQPNSGSR